MSRIIASSIHEIIRVKHLELCLVSSEPLKNVSHCVTWSSCCTGLCDVCSLREGEELCQVGQLKEERMFRSDTRPLIPVPGENGFFPPSFLPSITPSTSSLPGRAPGPVASSGNNEMSGGVALTPRISQESEEERGKPRQHDPSCVGTQVGQESRGAAGAAVLLGSVVMLLFVGPHHPQPRAGHPAYGISVPFSAPLMAGDLEPTEGDTQARSAD